MSAPVTSLEQVRELREAREDAAAARRRLQDLLHPPYMGGGMPAWAASSACGFLGHPARPNGGSCVCGGGGLSEVDREDPGAQDS